jgi:DNA-binding transcriptional ArsR family regulator
VEKTSSPPLLPIFRSQQQAELLALLLGDPELEVSLSDLSARLGVPYPSVHREVERAEAAGLLTSRRIGNTRLVRADTAGPLFSGLAEVLTRAFGVPAVLSETLRDVDGISEAYLFGSWAARFAGVPGRNPVHDIDLLVLGEPDRELLFERIHEVESRLGRAVQVTIRPPGWLNTGRGTFHSTIIARPLVAIPLASQGSEG